VLGIQCAPMTWPIGMGKRFRGVYHLYDDTIAFFDPQAEKGTAEIIQGLDNPRLDELIGSQADELRMDIELVRGASHPSMPRPTCGQAVAGLLRFGGQQLRRAEPARCRGRAVAAPRARGRGQGAVQPNEPSSPASCSRSRPTWTPSTATASPSCASAPAASSAA
jgi:hypothetical protein